MWFLDIWFNQIVDIFWCIKTLKVIDQAVKGSSQILRSSSEHQWTEWYIKQWRVARRVIDQAVKGSSQILRSSSEQQLAEWYIKQWEQWVWVPQIEQVLSAERVHGNVEDRFPSVPSNMRQRCWDTNAIHLFTCQTTLILWMNHTCNLMCLLVNTEQV